MRIAVEHVTRYSYQADATYSIQSLRMTPSDYAGQKTLAWRIDSRPASQMTASRDAFGNVVHLMTIDGAHRDVEIRVSGLLDVEDRQGVVQGIADVVPLRVFLRRTPLTTLDHDSMRQLRGAADGERIAMLHDLMSRIRDRVDYVPGATSAVTTAAEALAAGKGVCQDHTHIFLATARDAGIPARYVTGYLLLDGQEQADAHHAWAETWVDGLGWLSFDVANRICPTDRYVRMAVGLDAYSATPIRGSRRGGGAESLGVEVRVAQEMCQQ